MSYHTNRPKSKNIKGKTLIKSNMASVMQSDMTSVTDRQEISNRTKKIVPKTKKKKKQIRNIFQRQPAPPPPTLPEPERISIVKTLFDGANVRTFYGIEDTPIEQFISEVLKDVPLFKIDELDEQGNVLNTFQVQDKKMGGKKKSTLKNNQV